ncbi:MAG: sugar phosphate isomerase/epimerase [Treponema sp.]|jgi:sugar phosphate isomerase/epimerase|nr:sugar phosphate isomerase/epimerase [Treponema sp.]
MKIGAQLYTVRDYLKNEEGIEMSLRKLKTMGFDLIQLSGLGPCNIDHLAAWTKELGMEVCSTHSPWERVSDVNELKKLIEEHKKLGCNEIGVGVKPEIFPNTSEGYTRFIKKINGICKIVQGEGLTFGYQNHAVEFEKFNGVCALDRLVEECPGMYVILDLFWVQAGGANPVKYLEKFKGRIKLVHLKDYRISKGDRKFAEIGQGNLDWNDIMPLCEKNGIPYAIIEQDADFLNDPFDSLAMSKDYLVKAGYWK